jgi:hypothetical protein
MNRQLHPPTSFHQKKEPQYAFNGRVGESQTSGRFRVEVFFLTLSGIQPRFLGLTAHILVILLTSLSKLQGLMCEYNHFGLHHSCTENCNDHISYMKLKCKQHFSKCRQNFRLDRNRYAHARRDL